MKSTYLLPRQNIRDMKAIIDLVKEAGGRVLHLAPIIGSWVLETTPEIAEALDLVPWD